MPSPIEVRSTTDAMPTAMPKAVRKLRILWLDMEPMAIFMESLMIISNNISIDEFLLEHNFFRLNHPDAAKVQDALSKRRPRVKL
jgi:hypothetical protein